MSTLEFKDLFDKTIDDKITLFNESSNNSRSDNGIYKIDFSKVKDKKRGWVSVIRFLPNLRRDGTVGPFSIERKYHYVNIDGLRDVNGYYDSPRNFGEFCPLSDLYNKLAKSNNALMVERSKMIRFGREYYSYVLVIEDEQQPELVGKIMVFQYKKTIKDLIIEEKNGIVTGKSCNVFSLSHGKDFVLIANEIRVDDKKIYPDYKLSKFKPETTSLPIYLSDSKRFKNVPLNSDGEIPPQYHDRIKEFLLNREHDLEEFEPKRLTEEQMKKIEKITSYLLGDKNIDSDEIKQIQTKSYNDDIFNDDFGYNDMDYDDDFGQTIDDYDDDLV